MDLKEAKAAIIRPAIDKIRKCITEDIDIEKAQEFISLLHQQLEDLDKGFPVITACQVNNWACNLQVGDLVTDDKSYIGDYICENGPGLSVDSIYKVLRVKLFPIPNSQPLVFLFYEIIKSRDGHEGKQAVTIPSNSTRFKRIKFRDDVEIGFNS